MIQHVCHLLSISSGGEGDAHTGKEKCTRHNVKFWKPARGYLGVLSTFKKFTFNDITFRSNQVYLASINATSFLYHNT